MVAPPAPVACVASPWAPRAPCSRSCGGGRQRLARTVLTPARHGGALCGELAKSEECNPEPCPGEEETSLSPWGEWGACTATCGGGERRRSRRCTVEALSESLEFAKDIGGCERGEGEVQTEECGEEECVVVWWYRDTVGTAQGPFPSSQMLAWHTAFPGVFRYDTYYTRKGKCRNQSF